MQARSRWRSPPLRRRIWKRVKGQQWGIGQELLAARLPPGAYRFRYDSKVTASTRAIADIDGLGDFSYQLIRVDGTSESDIASATSSTYTLVDDDDGNRCSGGGELHRRPQSDWAVSARPFRVF